MFTVKTYAKGTFVRRDGRAIDQMTCVREGDEWTYPDSAPIVHAELRRRLVDLMLADPEMVANGWQRNHFVNMELRVIK